MSSLKLYYTGFVQMYITIRYVDVFDFNLETSMKNILFVHECMFFSVSYHLQILYPLKLVKIVWYIYGMSLNSLGGTIIDYRCFCN